MQIIKVILALKTVFISFVNVRNVTFVPTLSNITFQRKKKNETIDERGELARL